MSRLVIIEDAVVTSLISNTELLSVLPALKHAATVKGKLPADCGSCPAKARARSLNYAQVKKTIGNFRGANLLTLKKFLKADKIRVVFKNDSGNMVNLTM